ncbi:MAG TPA: site-specific integrase [Bacteroidales bacterium]|nr:site-specific integrase [Bacteroidales bacterium]
MKNKKAIFSIYLETRDPKVDNFIPVKVRVSYKRKRKYFAIRPQEINKILEQKGIGEFIYEGFGEFAISPDVIKKTFKDKPGGKFRLLKDTLEGIRSDAEQKAETLTFFSLENYQDIYWKVKTETDSDLLKNYELYILKLKDEKRESTAQAYQCSFISLKKFYQKKKLPYGNLTVEFLNRYENWMTEEQGNGLTTVGIYMRQLRTIFNQRPESLKEIPSPFGEKKYEIPKGKGRKIALSFDELRKVMEYSPKPEFEELYYDSWILQYFLNGINVTDLLLLRYKNMQNGFMEFVRHKTRRTKKQQEPIRIPISPATQKIINKYCQKKQNEETLIFNILNDEMTELQKLKAIKYHASMTSKTMKRIAAKLELDNDIASKISSYSSRHTFASVLMKKNAPVSYIQKQLGHVSLDTTASYLGSFEDEHLQEWQNKLTEF